MHTLETYRLTSENALVNLTQSACTLDDDGEIGYTTYGISLVDQAGNQTLFYPDISTSKEFVQGFIKQCIEHDAWSEHIPDILEDYME